MTLTRPQFDHACKAYLSKYSSSSTTHAELSTELLKKFPSGWTWNEHSLLSGLGFLSRSATIPYPGTGLPSTHDEEIDLLEAADDACTSVIVGSITCQQYICYSSTFQVPAFYFSLHESSGTPLSLESIAASPLFYASALPDSRRTTFALETSDSAFAMLSQGDHPTLNTPCWYLHPCHTAEVVDEIMREVACDEDGHSLRWLEAWFMMLGNVVDLRWSHECT